MTALAAVDTVAAIATAAGPAGLAVVRLTGPDAFRVAQRIFTPKNSKKTFDNMAGYTAAYGTLARGGTPVDDGVALCFRAPHSYTGENMVELSCHGGDAVSRAVLAALYEAGAAPAGPGEFTRRAVLNGRLGLTQAEAVMDLIAAGSRRGTAVAGAAVGGALQRDVQRQKQALVALAAHLAAETDYPEEGVEPLARDALREGMARGLEKLENLVETYDKGMLLRRGISAAIVGSPNVGKSTLFNLLSGFERAIVTPVAGTTRDVVREQVQVGDVVLQLSDTAGLRATDDVVEQAGIHRSEAEFDAAALVIAVFDGQAPLDAADEALARRCAGRPALGLINKSDLGTRLSPGALAPYFGEVLVVSARDPATAGQVGDAIQRIMGLGAIPGDAPLLANDRQLAAAVAARDALGEGLAALDAGLGTDAAGVCLEDAVRALAALLGEDATEAVLDEVFSRFCVGK